MKTLRIFLENYYQTITLPVARKGKQVKYQLFYWHGLLTCVVLCLI